MSVSANINGLFTSFLNRAPTAQEDQYWQQEVSQKGLVPTIDSFSQAALQARGNNLTPYQTTQWNNLVNQYKIPAGQDRAYLAATQNGSNTSLQAFLDAAMAPDSEGQVSNEQYQTANTLRSLYNQGGAPAIADWYKEQNIGNYMATMQRSNSPDRMNGVQDGGTWGFIKDAAPIMAAVFGGGYALSGLMGAGAAGAAGAGAAGAAGAGEAAAAGGAAASTGAAGLGTAAAGTAAAEAAIPTVSVVGAAGGAGAGAGLGTAAAVGGGLAAGGLASMGGSGSAGTNVGNTQVDPNIPQVVVNGNTGATGSTSLGNMMNPALGSAGALLTPDQVSGPTPTAGLGDSFPINGAPSTGTIPPVGGVPSGGSSSTTPTGTTGLPNLPSGLGLGDLLKGLGAAASGYADYKMNQADKDYYQQLMDKMMGMYNPGTPEANLMEQKMRAQDAAAGRNSQYGVRAINLAGMLADQRSKIMTSPAFEKMAEASRGHYDSSLASLSNMLGGATTSGTALNGILNSAGSAITNSSWGQSLSDWFKSATAPER